MSDPVAALSAALSDRYKIERELGHGGMATVYLAHDVKHDRKVALKVLRPELAAVLGAERFLQEIKTTASLQHPHILPLFDSGQAVVPPLHHVERGPGGEAFLYYVMPFIDGENLRDTLNRETLLRIDEAIQITSSVADALDYAHRQGVIHRDIKPENILLHDGRPIVADFGIALAVSAAAGGRMTETGMSLGTPHYMSPEQATADRDVSSRSDVYSLGCVLYEMLTGEPPHMGNSAQQVIMKIVTDEPRPVTELRKSVPPNVAAAVAQSLEKLPADRFETAKAFAAALGDSSFTTPTFAIASRTGRPRAPGDRLTVALVAIALIATGMSVWGWLRSGALNANGPVVEFYLQPPDSTMSFAFNPVVSPDGRRLVAQVETDDGSRLYQRMLDERDWREIPGTEGAFGPFFSPDGEWLGFASGPETIIKRVPVEGGAAQTIARANQGLAGASWGPDNMVVFSTNDTIGGGGPSLFRVPAEGGVPEQLTTLEDASGVHISPHALPGGRVVLFTTAAPGIPPAVAALSLETGAVTRLVDGMTPTTDRAGRLVYVTPNGLVLAQPFDQRTMTLEGSPQRLAEGVAVYFGAFAAYSLSPGGSLAYLAGSSRDDELVLVTRAGATRPLLAETGAVVPAAYVHPRFSPSGDRVAFVRSEGVDLGDVWVYSLAEGTAQRLTFQGATADPAWSDDGRWLGYSVAGQEEGAFATLYRRRADATGSAEQIQTGAGDLWQIEFAPGGNEIVFRSVNDLFRATLGGDADATLLTETPSSLEQHPVLSPRRSLARVQVERVRTRRDLCPVVSGHGTTHGRVDRRGGRSRMVGRRQRAVLSGPQPDDRRLPPVRRSADHGRGADSAVSHGPVSDTGKPQLRRTSGRAAIRDGRRATDAGCGEGECVGRGSVSVQRATCSVQDLPRWARDGRTLFFYDERQLWSAAFDPATGEAGTPRLFAEVGPLFGYDLLPDGRVLAVLQPAERGTVRFEEFLRSLGAETVGMAAITASELLDGCHRATPVSAPGVRRS